MSQLLYKKHNTSLKSGSNNQSIPGSAISGQYSGCVVHCPVLRYRRNSIDICVNRSGKTTGHFKTHYSFSGVGPSTGKFCANQTICEK